MQDWQHPPANIHADIPVMELRACFFPRTPSLLASSISKATFKQASRHCSSDSEIHSDNLYKVAFKSLGLVRAIAPSMPCGGLAPFV